MISTSTVTKSKSTTTKRWALYNTRTQSYLKTFFDTRSKARLNKTANTKIVDLKNGIFVR